MSEGPTADTHGTELLVILDRAAAADTLERLRRHHRVTQVGSPRIVVVQVSPRELAPSPSTPGMLAVSSGAVPDSILEELEDTERLFVKAWESRMSTSDWRRKGAELSWDATGFEPPDEMPKPTT